MHEHKESLMHHTRYSDGQDKGTSLRDNIEAGKSPDEPCGGLGYEGPNAKLKRWPACKLAPLTEMPCCTVIMSAGLFMVGYCVYCASIPCTSDSRSLIESDR